jgi:uncharacterized membrane protein
MNYFFRYLALFSVIFFSLLSPRVVVHAGEPVVHAVLFYSPTCPHCYKVITEDLIPLLDIYGEGLSILGIDTYTEQGQELYQAAIIHFQIPNERRGVPTLIVGKTVLVGSYEIPEQFPSIIESKLAKGGVDWPDIPGLDELIEEVPVEPEAEALEENEIDQSQSAVEEEVLQSVDFADKDIEKTKPNQVEGSSNTTNGLAEAITTTETMTLPERFMRDKTGNSISILVLLGMVISMIWVGIKVLGSNQVTKKWPNWVIPLLLLIGLGVAIYMGYVEITQTEAVCGPVGDCNTVQQSPYARLFGLLPVGVLGLLGYLALMIAWTIQYYGPAGWKEPATWVIWGMALFGTIFSIYLTFLEPFVIGATCVWCLTSAIVMTLLLWAATTPVMQSRIASRHTLQSSGGRHPHPDLK